jgi:hypothetical protein
MRPARLVIALAVGALLAGCRSPAAPSAPSATPSPTPGFYRDVAAAAGIQFRFSNGSAGRHYLLETTGSGCAFFDFNRDGWPDLLFLQAGPLPGEPRSGSQPRNRLYRNNGNGTFADVTAGSGLEDTGYAQGVAVGDVNGDGHDDVFLTAYGGNHLFLNDHGSGRFRDATARAGLADTAKGPRWCTSAAFGDYDGDGRLDLFVARYAEWSPRAEKPCRNPRGESSYCSPELYPPEVHALYRGNGDGTFRDVSRQAGITRARGHGLGVAWLDYDGDGWEDIFVANDLNPYLLWHNNGDGSFSEVGQKAGVALSDMGQLLSGMGVGVRDYNGDGREDLFVTNFSGQMNALYRNDGRGLFTNTTIPSGIGAASFTRLAFGCEFLDFDRDGWPDLLIGNGHVNEDVQAYSQGISYAQPKSLLRNAGDGTFAEVKDGLGDLATPRVTRGLAVADVDRDGHLDVAANDQDGAAELLHYTGPEAGHWLGLDLRGVKSNPNGLHARVTIRAGGRSWTAERRSGSSFCSHSEGRLYFGLGSAVTVDEMRIVWHGSRTVTTARDLPADRAYRAVEGQGVAAAPRPGAAVEPS